MRWAQHSREHKRAEIAKMKLQGKMEDAQVMAI
jgi:hypothetical protein